MTFLLVMWAEMDQVNDNRRSKIGSGMNQRIKIKYYSCDAIGVFGVTDKYVFFFLSLGQFCSFVVYSSCYG